MSTEDPEVLTGKRVRLRPFTVDDAQAVADACQDAEIHRWTVTIPWPYTEAHARAWIETHAARRRTGSGHHFAFVDAATNEFGGSISLERRAAEPGSAGVGYWTAALARRRGYATEALSLVVGFAFDRTDIDRIILVTMVGNERSEGVAARCGFEVVGTDDAHTYGAGAGGSYPARIWELRRQVTRVDAQLPGSTGARGRR